MNKFLFHFTKPPDPCSKGESNVNSNVDWDELIHVVRVKTVVEVEDCCNKTDCIQHGIRVVQDMHEVDQSWRCSYR
ncbi:hypothetical protein Tco_0408200 [Tanacetum coccineum]